MNVLLDTHALVWWWLDDAKLPVLARSTIASTENTISVSAASAWEIATKHRLGKWPDVETIVQRFSALIRQSRFSPLPISVEHAHLAGSLSGSHRDPFDRVLIAQARIDDMALISRDAVFRDFAVSLIWS